MKPIIYAATERDGKGYHPAGKDGFSVLLAIDVAPEEEEDAESAFRTLLAALQGLRIAFYAFADPDATAPSARVDPEVVPAAVDGDADALATWLKQRQTDAAFWEHLAADTGEATSLRAGQLLRSAHQWPGPLPHRHRLTVVARVEAGALNEGTWRLLPFFDEPPASDALLIEIRPDDIENLAADTIAYDALGGMGRVIAVANVVPKQIEDVPVVDEATGFVEGLATAAETLVLLDKLEERGATLFWPTPYLSDQLVRDAFKTDDEFETQRLGELRALAGVVSALDPVFLALLMPGAGTVSFPAEGPMLDLLLDALEERGLAVDRIDAVGRIRAALLTLPLFSDPATLHEKETYRTVLVTLAGLRADGDYQELLSLVSRAVLDGSDNERRGDLGALDRELGAVVTDLNAEAGAERAVIAVFEALVVAKRVWDAVRNTTDWSTAKDAAAEQAARTVTSVDVAVALARALGLDDVAVHDVAAAFEAFRSTLLGTFNGAAAIRQAAGAVLIDAVGRDPDDIIGHLRATPYMKMRFARGDPDPPDDADRPLAKVASSLPAAMLRLGDRQLKAVQAVFEASLADALRLDATTRRFEPDPAPRPLPVPLTGSSNPDELAIFSQRYNGLALLIRAETQDVLKTPWACANLAAIAPNYDGAVEEAAVLPLTPLLVDGQSRMFTRYDGLPFAASAFASTRPAGQPTGASVHGFAGTGGPSYFDTEAWADGGHALLPPLVYGARYESAVFAVTGGGSLSSAIWAAADRPWQLGSPETLTVPASAVAHTDYSRRTAIGRVGLAEADSPRIGREIARVQPLAADYPRFAVTPAAHVDVLRQPNGRGAIAFQTTSADATPEVLTVRLDDVYAAAGGMVTIAVYDAPDPAIRIAPQTEPTDTTRPPRTIVTLAPAEGATITLKFVRKGGENDRVVVENGNISHERVLAPPTPDAPATYWLRLWADEPVSLAVPDLDFTPEGRDRSEAQPPILLVAGDDQRWRDEVRGAARLKVHAPRVGFQDFQRWLLNSRLRNLHEGAAGRASPAGILDAAEVAYAVRHARTPEGEPAIGVMLDSLPDPAVAGLLVEMIRLDSLTGHVSETIVHSMRLKRIGDIVPIKDMPQPIGEEQVKSVAQRYREFLRALRKPYELQLEISEGTFALTANDSGIVAQVPAGTVALLAIRPLVPAAYFEKPAQGAAAIDLEMLQLARGEATLRDGQHQIPCVVFEGERITVEAMTPKMDSDGRTLADEFLEVVPARQARSYQLRSRGRGLNRETNLENAWRHIYRIDVHTQRWTFGGRPIYSWLSPQTAKNRSSAPAMEIQAGAPVAAFEDEIFLGRSDEDQIVRTVNLDPLPGATLLETFSWELPSATWFRHRFGLRSRYEGAFRRLAEGNGYLASWRTKESVWHTRVAMLADCARVSLARPQLRAYLPLTVSPDADAAPPVVAILQEPPLAAGGLADRMSAEVATALDYHFAPNLQLETVRREAGRDPRLTYRPLPDGRAAGADHNPGTDDGNDQRHEYSPASDLARGLALVGEGPVGLTFDSNASVGAAWANSLWSFAPLGLVDKDLPVEGQEFFMRAFLQRRLAPEWVFDPAPPLPGADGEVPQDDIYWLDLALTGQPPAAGLFLGASDRRVVLSVTQNGDYLVAATERRLLDVAASDGMVTMATVKATQTAGLSAMLQPLSAGKGIVSIYARLSPSDPVSGRSNAPLLLASFHWSAPQDGDLPLGDLPLVAVGVQGLWRTAASQPSEGEWVRTGRDFDRLYAVVDRNGVCEVNTTVDAVIPTLGVGGALVFRNADGEELWLRSREQATMPVGHVHRQLFVLVSRPSRELGRKVMVFHAAVRAEAKEIRLDPPPPAESRVSVVEIEIPARPLAFFPDGSPAALDYGAIDIDLKALAARPLVDGVLVSLRFVPGWDDPRTMTFHLEDKQLHLAFEGGALAGCDIVFRRTLAGGTEVRAEAIGRNGLRQGVTVTRDEALALSFRPSFHSLALRAVRLARWDGQAPGEFWCDASVRTLYRTVTPGGAAPDALELSAFPFEWLFSDETGSARAERVFGEVDLARLTEVEARIVSVSDAMVIERQ